METDRTETAPAETAPAPRALDRREFLRAAPVAAAGFAIASSGAFARAASPNAKKTVGVIGVRGRGRFLAEYLAARPDTNVAYVCDVDRGVLDACAAAVERISGRRPEAVGDFRRILDDKSADAIVNATPDHWHALPVIMACQAGKHAYTEKPAAHNIFEGRKMVEAARKYDRVVQHGTQTRSGKYLFEAIDYVRSGKLGRVHLIRVCNLKNVGPNPVQPDGEPPAGVDYDTWLGPAPKRPFNPNRFHGGWYYQWDYSNGDIVNDAIHQIDLARWLLGKDYPRFVSSTGGKFHFDDSKETPDTQVATYDFGDATMVFELTLWAPYMEKIPLDVRDGDKFPDWPFCATKIEIFGTNGLMLLGRHGGGWQVFAPDHSVAAQAYGRVPLAEHFDDFYDAIDTGRRPNADIEEAHRSTMLSHLANISFKLGGRRIELDPATERIVGDEEAQRMTRRESYREPWVVRDEV